MPLFPGQRDDEQIILFVRRHWFVLVRYVALFVVLALLPLAIQWLLVSFAGESPLGEGTLGDTLVTLTVYLYWLFVAMFAYASWLDYYLDYWVVTNRRIVSVEQKGLLARTVAQVYLQRVQDATAQQHGLFPTMLHYGDAFIQSAGEEARFVFAEVPNPNRIVAVVMEQHRKLEPEHKPESPASL
ncbi:MAG: PH domain-containing protein [Candidatus Kerfeldbacteria bacterium]|nr:PH domain-containing protein [Candidatus Kerfeldbacteria bacterium]